MQRTAKCQGVGIAEDLRAHLLIHFGKPSLLYFDDSLSQSFINNQLSRSTFPVTSSSFQFYRENDLKSIIQKNRKKPQPERKEDLRHSPKLLSPIHNRKCALPT